MKDTKYITEHNKGGFQLMIYHNGKSTYHGIYKTLEEAILVRNKTLKLIGHTNTSKTYNAYVDNKEMMYEMIVSQAQGKLSPKLLKMCMLIVKNVNKKFKYKEPEDRQDVIAYSYEIIIKNWMMFDIENFNNPFAWTTEVIKRAHALQFKQLQKTRLNTISLDYTDENGNKMLNF